MRVTETAHWLEWQDWVDPILQQPYTIKDGHLHIPDVPGVGIEWNELNGTRMRLRHSRFRQRPMSVHGTSRHLVALHQFNRFRSEADISKPRLPRRIYEYA